MLNYPCRVLFIEDNFGDVVLVREALEEMDPLGFEIRIAGTLAEGLTHLQSGIFDVILLDLSLPDCQGLESLKRAKALAGEIPIIVLTGLADGKTLSTALEKGAQDYLIKDQENFDLLHHSIKYSIERNGLALQLGQPTMTDLSKKGRIGRVLEGMAGLLQEEHFRQTKTIINCNEVVNKILNFFKNELIKENVTFLQDHLPNVRGDRLQIPRLFQQLIWDAVVYRSKDHNQVEMTACQTGTDLLFSLVQTTKNQEKNGSQWDGIPPPPDEPRETSPFCGPGWSNCKKIVLESGGTMGHRPLAKGEIQIWFSLPQSFLT